MSSQQYFCHHCNRSVGLRADNDLICAQCGSDFVEQLPHSPAPAIFGPSVVHRSRPGLNPRVQVYTQYLAVPRAPSAQAGLNARAYSLPRSMRRPDTPLPPAPPLQAINPGAPNRGILAPFFNLVNVARPPNIPPAGPGEPQPQNVQREVNARDIMATLAEVLNQSNQNANGPQVRVEFRMEGPGRGNFMHIGDYAFGDMDTILSNLMNLNGFGEPTRSITEEQLQYLPMTHVNQAHVNNKTQCSTCFDEFTLNEPVAELRCTHIFHADCVKPWLLTHNTCPVCRGEVDPAEWNIPANAAAQREQQQGAPQPNQQANNADTANPAPPNESASREMVEDELD